MAEHHFNTTHESGETLRRMDNQAANQEREVLRYFEAWPCATPSEVHRALYPRGDVPLTSVRRAITNLTNLGKLRRTEHKLAGEYGRPEYVWELVE